MITQFRQYWYHSRISSSAPVALKNYLGTPLPTKGRLLSHCEFLVLDLELTGLSEKSDEIVSVGFVPVIDQQIVLSGAKHFVLRTQKSVGHSATIHGIHDRHSDQGITLEEAMNCVLNALKGRVIVCHCAPLDIAFLQAASVKVFGTPFIRRSVDTMAIEQSRLRRQGKALSSDDLRLHSCRNRYSLPNYRAHNALDDAIATAELLLVQMSHLGVTSRSRLKCLYLP